MNTQVHSNQNGFTLIELVVVIVILGILAATALPRFVNLAGDAGNAAAQGVAGSMASASSMNHSRRLISAGAGVALNGATICQTAANWTGLVSGVGFTAGAAATTPANDTTFDVSGIGDCSAANAAGTTVNCLVTGRSGNATATVICSN